MSDPGPYTGSGHLDPDLMGSGEMTPEMLGARPCADEVSSLVQSVRDHAATMRKLADVEGQRDLAWEAKARVRALHSPDDGSPMWCVACEVKYPCQTILALDGPRP